MALATADRRNARCFAQVLGVGGVANISAQARATSESVVLLPGMVAKPLFSTVLPRSHELALASSAILADASLCVRYWAAQIGASATTTASCAAVAASLRAVPPVTQPPHVKPMIMQAMAPPTAPHIRGLVFAGNCMASPFRAALRPSGRRARDRAADDQHDGENREQERRYRPAAHAFTSRWAGAQASLSRRRPETWGATVDTATPCVRVCPTGSLSYLEQHPLP